jgi:CheY-like chemotaxis protein
MTQSLGDFETHDEPDLSGTRVLLATDETMTTMVLSACFGSLGMPVLCADNAEAAWEQACTHHPEVVVMDLMLPALKHRGLAARFAAELKPAPVVVLLCSDALAPQDEGELCRQCGAAALVSKPFSGREVVARVLDALERRGGPAARPRARAVPPPLPVDAFAAPETSAPAAPVAPPMQGSASLQALSQLLGHAFLTRMDGVLVVQSGTEARQLYLHRGLLVATSSTLPEERLGGWLMAQGLLDANQMTDALKYGQARKIRMGYAVAQVAGVSPEKLAHAVVQQIWWVAARALQTTQARYVLAPAMVNLTLSTQVVLDPLEAVHRACLEVSEAAAHQELLREEDGELRWNNTAQERLLALPPLARGPLQALVAARPRLSHILERPPTPNICRQILAMLRTQAAWLQPHPDSPPPPPQRPALINAANWPEDAPRLQPATAWARRAVALEWLRTGGATPHEVLEVPVDAGPAQVLEAAQFRLGGGAFGAPSEEGLGPAKALLEVVRARVSESARLLGQTTLPLPLEAAPRVLPTWFTPALPTLTLVPEGKPDRAGT